MHPEYDHLPPWHFARTALQVAHSSCHYACFVTRSVLFCPSPLDLRLPKGGRPASSLHSPSECRSQTTVSATGLCDFLWAPPSCRVPRLAVVWLLRPSGFACCLSLDLCPPACVPGGVLTWSPPQVPSLPTPCHLCSCSRISPGSQPVLPSLPPTDPVLTWE